MLREGCVFCKIATRDIDTKVIFEDSKIMAFEDLRPQAPVHILIIPKAHIDKFSDLSDEDANLIGRLLLTAKGIAAERAIEESGYRLVLNCNKDGGQEVFHLHLHLLGGRPMAWPPG